MSQVLRGSNAVDATEADFHVYADGTGGDDANDGLTVGTPVKTLQRAFGIVPQLVRHNVAVHCVGTFTDSAVLAKSFDSVDGLNKTIIIDGGDNFTILDGPRTSDISSVSTIGDTGAGWTVDQYKGRIVHVTGGPAAGERRMIYGNTATTITAHKDFTTDPGAGASFQIEEPTTLLDNASFRSLRVTCTGNGQVTIQRLKFERLYFLSMVNGGDAASVNLGFGTISDGTNTSGAVQAVNNLVNIWEFLWDPDDFSFPDFTKQLMGFSQVNAASKVRLIGSRLTAPALFAEHLDYSGSRGSDFDVRGGSRLRRVTISGGAELALAEDANFLNTSGYRATKVDGSAGVGLLVQRASVEIAAGVEISGHASHGIDVSGGLVKFTGAAVGSGNGGAGILVRPNSKVLIADGSPPTLTGTAGEISINGTSQASTWAAIDAGTPIANGPGQVFVSESDLASAAPASSDAGYSIQYGAKLDAVDRFALVNGDAVIGKLPSLDQRTEATVPVAGNLTRLSWNSATANATTVIKIHKNAVVVQTKTLTGAKGSVSLTGAVAAGDELAIEYDAGTAPDQSNWIIMIGP